MPIEFPYDGAYAAELRVATTAARRASAVILEFYDANSAATYTKADGSQVTDADLASDRAIREEVGSAFPEDGLLTEEGAASAERLSKQRVWIADPIDGTAEYVKRTGRFDVMIALAVDGQPVVAVCIQPVTGLIQAAAEGAGAWEIHEGVLRPFRIAAPEDSPRIVTSKWYGGREPERAAAIERIAGRLGAPSPPVLEVGYQSRAFSPEFRAWDGYIGLPPFGTGSIAQEWDLACVDLLTWEAGGAFTDCYGRRHRYNKRSTGISGGVMASANPELHARMVDACRPDLPLPPPASDPADDGL